MEHDPLTDSLPALRKWLDSIHEQCDAMEKVVTEGREFADRVLEAMETIELRHGISIGRDGQSTGEVRK